MESRMNDPAALKDREHRTWTHVAPGWRKHDAMLTRLSRPVSLRMLDLAGVGAGHRVLDIACGTGEPALPAAERVGPAGFVLATDVVEDMLAFAREKAAARGLGHVEFRGVDGEALDVPPASFDAATIRWGLMFMPDPVACLSRARVALRPGGRIAAACWAPPEKNPFIAVPVAAIRRHVDVPQPPPGAPGIFAFADPARLRAVLEEAGFSEVAVEPLELVMSEFDTPEEGWTFLRELAGPIAMLVAAQPPDVLAAIGRDAVAAFEQHAAGGKIRMSGTTWIASGRA
jgi:ubiquinone/menaquinone biosynthesis C-methylase UbiE